MRHPKVTIDPKNIDDETVLSPSYGTIKKIGYTKTHVHIIIFLSVTDVHVQYYPIRGIVTDQVHDDIGTYHLAYKLNKSDKNEKVITTIKPKLNIGDILVYQIAGLVARRISTTLTEINEEVEPSQKLGMIYLGSRVDLILPKRNLELYVKENDYVHGFNTVIGRYI